MNPPVKLHDLHELWGKDSGWDDLNPHVAINNIPRLHAKYLNIYSYHSFLVKSLKKDYTKLRYFYLQYYGSHYNTDEELLAKHGLEPFQKQAGKDINIYIDSNPEIIKLLTRIDYNEEIVNFCDKVIKELNSRTWQLRSYIDYLKWADERPKT